MSDSTIEEQLAEARRRRFDAELQAARLEVSVELDEAKAVAYRAAVENARLRDRVDELEKALGRRQRLQRDAALGLERLRLLEDLRRGDTA